MADPVPAYTAMHGPTPAPAIVHHRPSAIPGAVPVKTEGSWDPEAVKAEPLSKQQPHAKVWWVKWFWGHTPWCGGSNGARAMVIPYDAGVQVCLLPGPGRSCVQACTLLAAALLSPCTPSPASPPPCPPPRPPLSPGPPPLPIPPPVTPLPIPPQ